MVERSSALPFANDVFSDQGGEEKSVRAVDSIVSEVSMPMMRRNGMRWRVACPAYF